MTNVNAATEYEESLIYKIAPDGENATLKMVKPTDAADFYITLENVLNELLNDTKYKASAYANNAELTNCDVCIFNNNNEEIGTYNINVAYDEPEEYAKAAQKRIDDYLGENNKIKVTYGGTLNSLEDYTNEEDLLQKENNDGNYYNVTIEGETYKFYIMKGSDEQLKKTKYEGKHIKSDIKITTDNSEVPLDTHLTVKTVESEEIKKAIGTDNYDAYDIKLYSDTKSASITKLDNGKFLVSIPVSSSLNGKNIVTYYLNSNNELEEYETVVKDG